MKIAASVLGFVVASSLALGCASATPTHVPAAARVVVEAPVDASARAIELAPEGPMNGVAVETVGVIITLSGARPMGDVVRDLSRAGFSPEQNFESLQIVAGRAPVDAFAKLAAIDGVTAVEREQVFTTQQT